MDKIRCIIDDELQLDFKFNNIGLYYIPKPYGEKNLLEIKQAAKDYRPILGNIQNVKNLQNFKF
jgi:hypothetical protein